jgi:uncharacterized protein YecE (DUF72 family)
MKHPNQIHIGTSGWHYDHWKGPFYPEKTPDKALLNHYIRHFRTTEINNSFYKLPSEKTLATWRNSTPEGFLFSVKGSRFITHMKKLKDPELSLPPFIERIDLLGEKLGPILFQLPPNWRYNGDRLRRFVRELPEGYRYVFEFRDPSWVNEESLEMLEERGIALCIYDMAGETSQKDTPGEFVYLRLHGPEEDYGGSYDPQTLAGWVGAFSAWTDKGKEVFCYFDNDEAGYAPLNAKRLQEMIHK